MRRSQAYLRSRYSGQQLLAADPHALLAARRALVAAALQAQEGVLEGHHAGVDEEQRRVVRHEGRAGHDRVALPLEEVEESLPDLLARHALLLRRSSRLGSAGPRPPSGTKS